MKRKAKSVRRKVWKSSLNNMNQDFWSKGQEIERRKKLLMMKKFMICSFGKSGDEKRKKRVKVCSGY